MNILSESQVSMNISLESIVLKILHIFKPEIPENILLDLELNIPILQYNATIEDITVDAGLFSAYKIEFVDGLFGSIYYAPDAGNLIKTAVNMEIPGEMLINVYGELTETNYI
jgi:hypothetical protein